MADKIIVPVDPMSDKPVELWRKYMKQGRISEPAKMLRFVFFEYHPMEKKEL